MSENDNGHGKESGVFPSAASQELTVAALQGDGAQKIFRRALNERDERSKEHQCFLAEHPDQALAVLERDRDKLALSQKEAADALEIVLGDLPKERARELMEAHLTPQRISELVRGRGDLPSVAAYIADLPYLVRAVFEDIRSCLDLSDAGQREGTLFEEEDAGDGETSLAVEENHEPLPLEPVEDARAEDDADPMIVVPTMDGKEALAFSVLHAWATKLSDRPDFQDFLNYPCGGWTIRDCLLYALALEASPHAVPASTFDAFGMEPNQAREQLEVMLMSGRVPSLDAETVGSARAVAIRRCQGSEEEEEVEGAAAARVAAANKAGKLGDF